MLLLDLNSHYRKHYLVRPIYIFLWIKVFSKSKYGHKLFIKQYKMNLSFSNFEVSHLSNKTKYIYFDVSELKLALGLNLSPMKDHINIWYFHFKTLLCTISFFVHCRISGHRPFKESFDLHIDIPWSNWRILFFILGSLSFVIEVTLFNK